MANVDLAPRTLVLVRHGESMANIVQEANKNGDTTGYTDTFRNTPNSEMPLTDRGIWQAQAAGIWIRKNIDNGVFGEYYMSSFIRARQTAGYLNLPEGRDGREIWKEREDLREQSWGHFDGMPIEERLARYPDIMATKGRDREHWAGLGGESMVQVIDRIRAQVLPFIYRDLKGGRTGIGVSHGNTLLAIRVGIESIPSDKLREMDEHPDPLDKIYNCQILQYTSVNPEEPSEILDNFGWMRSVCPWNMSLSRNEWMRIIRPKFSNDQLLLPRYTSNA